MKQLEMGRFVGRVALVVLLWAITACDPGVLSDGQGLSEAPHDDAGLQFARQEPQGDAGLGMDDQGVLPGHPDAGPADPDTGPGEPDAEAPPSCPPFQHLCNGSCVDDTSPATCGAACQPCTAPGQQAATCTGGQCGHVDGQTWAMVIAYMGAPLPKDLVSHLCEGVVPRTAAWFAREAGRYGVPLPFRDVECIDGQVELPESLRDNSRQKIDYRAALNRIKNAKPEVATARYVTIIMAVKIHDDHYSPHAYSTEDFNVLPVAVKGIPIGPSLPGATLIQNIPSTKEGIWAEHIAHELAHNLGASDKYGTTPEAACLINPATGQQYSGYDIMCHRIVDPSDGSGFIFPPFDELKVTGPTAREIGWK
jgi:hypothetical protein